MARIAPQPDPDTAPFGAVLWRLRMKPTETREAMTQAGVGELAGLAASSVAVIERGLRAPGNDAVERIADALQCTPDERRELVSAAALSRALVSAKRDPRNNESLIDTVLGVGESLQLYSGRQKDIALGLAGAKKRLTRQRNHFTTGQEKAVLDKIDEFQRAAEKLADGIRVLGDIMDASGVKVDMLSPVQMEDQDGSS